MWQDQTPMTEPKRTSAKPARQATNDDPLMSPAEASALLDYAVSAETIRRWMRKGIVPLVRVGPYRRAMIRRSVVFSVLLEE